MRADPTFTQAIAEFQKDPSAAKQKYANNEKVSLCVNVYHCA